jgi:hypothetical protein
MIHTEGATPSEVARAHQLAVGGARPRCDKGKACSAACVFRGDRCLVEIPDPHPMLLQRSGMRLNQRRQNSYNLLEWVILHLRKNFRGMLLNSVGQMNWQSTMLSGGGSREEYDRLRQRVVDYNKTLVREGVAEKTGLVNVPVTWEKLQRVSKAYEKAKDATEEKMINLARLGNKDEYNKEERKLMAIQRKIGVKLGADDEMRRKGEIWENEDGDRWSRNYFLKALSESPKLKGATIEHDGRGEMDIRKTIGKNTVLISLYNSDRGIDTSFQINGSYARMDRGTSENTRLVLAIRSMFKDIVSNMDEGTVLKCVPYNGDGYGDERRSAYERFGFKTFSSGAMYGTVFNGKVTPADRDDLDEYSSRYGYDDNRLF